MSGCSTGELYRNYLPNAGADIEGGFLAQGEEFIYITSANNDLNDQAAHLGTNTVKDIREETTRNAFQLTRGIEAINNSGQVLDLDLANLEDGAITYIKGGLVRLETPESCGRSVAAVIPLSLKTQTSL